MKNSLSHTIHFSPVVEEHSRPYNLPIFILLLVDEEYSQPFFSKIVGKNVKYL